MPLDVKVYLHDILRACDAISEFVEGKMFEDYQHSLLLRSGVERQLAIVGEALNQALKLEPELKNRVTSTRQIIDFRNVLVHAYMSVSAPVVWNVIENHLPLLRREINALLIEFENSD